jgi:hypothetical protein
VPTLATGCCHDRCVHLAATVAALACLAATVALPRGLCVAGLVASPCVNLAPTSAPRSRNGYRVNLAPTAPRDDRRLLGSTPTPTRGRNGYRVNLAPARALAGSLLGGTAMLAASFHGSHCCCFLSRRYGASSSAEWNDHWQLTWRFVDRRSDVRGGCPLRSSRTTLSDTSRFAEVCQSIIIKTHEGFQRRCVPHKNRNRRSKRPVIHAVAWTAVVVTVSDRSPHARQRTTRNSSRNN